jgi:hypothetical protein
MAGIARGTPSRPGVSVARPMALTMPAVTVWSSPKGLPMATAVCPTCRSTSSASGATARSSTPARRMTATSVLGSAPSTVPS